MAVDNSVFEQTKSLVLSLLCVLGARYFCVVCEADFGVLKYRAFCRAELGSGFRLRQSPRAVPPIRASAAG